MEFLQDLQYCGWFFGRVVHPYHLQDKDVDPRPFFTGLARLKKREGVSGCQTVKVARALVFWLVRHHAFIGGNEGDAS